MFIFLYSLFLYILFIIYSLLNNSYLIFLFSFSIYTLIFLLIVFTYKLKTSIYFKKLVIIGIITATLTTLSIILIKYLINYFNSYLLLSNSEELSIACIFSISLLRYFIREMVTWIVDNYTNLGGVPITYNGIDINEYKKPLDLHIHTANNNPQSPNNNPQSPNNNRYQVVDDYFRDVLRTHGENIPMGIVSQEESSATWIGVCRKFAPIGNNVPNEEGIYNYRDRCLLSFFRRTHSGIDGSIHLVRVQLDPVSESKVIQGYNKNDFASNQPAAAILADAFEFLHVRHKRHLGRDLLKNTPGLYNYIKQCIPSSLNDTNETGVISKELISRLRRN